MKEYKYKNKMFYLYDNDIEKFKSKLKMYFEDLYVFNVSFSKNEFIDITISDSGNVINLKFVYNPIYFIKCYEFQGIYTSEKYKGSRKIINDILVDI